MIPDEFPAVTVPPSRNAGFMRPSASSDVSARGCSSRPTTTGSPLSLRNGDRHDLVVEAAAFDRRDRPLVRPEREAVLEVTPNLPTLGDVFGRLAHRIRIVLLGELRVDEPPTQRRVIGLAVAAVERGFWLGHDIRRARHGLDAAGNEHVAVVGGDRVGRGVDRLETRTAQSVDGLAGHLDRQVGQQRGHPGDVAIVLAGLVGGAQDHVLDERRVDAGSIDDRPNDRRRQVVRPNACERPAVAPDGGSDGLDDPGLAERPVEIARHGGIVGRPRSRAAERVLRLRMARWSERGRLGLEARQ